MVNEAEKYKAEDEAAASRITAKNGLETYGASLSLSFLVARLFRRALVLTLSSLSLSFARAAYSLRNSIEGDLKDKLEADDKESLDKAITETISWLDASSEASKEEYEEKQKELEGVANRASLFLPSSSSSSPSPSFLPRPPRPRTSC